MKEYIPSQKEYQQMRTIYYKPDHLWVNNRAIKLLEKESGLPRRKVIHFLARQALYQVHILAPREVHHPHYIVTRPNQIHQFDLLFMTGDKLYGNKYKYILSGIDVASRYKVARPLKSKTALEVVKVLKDIYKKGPLKYPEVVMLDGGSEFKGSVTKLFEENNVTIDRVTTKYHHEHTAFVEALIKQLAKSLFKPQDSQELQDPEKTATIWVKYLQTTVANLNNRKTAMTGKKPKDIIRLDEVPLVKKEEYPPEKVLELDALYRYLLQPGEEHGDQRRRATDRIWSKETFKIDHIIEEPKNRILYYLKDGPERAFVSERADDGTL